MSQENTEIDWSQMGEEPGEITQEIQQQYSDLVQQAENTQDFEIPETN